MSYQASPHSPASSSNHHHEYPGQSSNHPQQGQGGESQQYDIINLDQNDYEEQPMDEIQWACQAFVEKSRRMAFVRKVLGVVGLQLLVCAAVTAVCLFSGKQGKDFIRKYYWLAFIAVGIWLIINIANACCDVGRGPPSCLNVTLLIIGTLAMSVFCGFISIQYSINVILSALSTTIGILLVLVLITLFTKIDITGWGIYLAVAGLFLMIGTFVLIILFSFALIPNETKQLILLVVSFIIVILLCFYILWILQLIMGGRRHQISEDDWLYACLILFGDIIQMFLQLMGIYSYFEKS